MKRRALLKGMAAGTAVAAWPGWIRDAFAAGCSPKRLAIMNTAFRSAQRSGKPLLVFVIPTSVWGTSPSGKMLGEFLTAGEEKDLAALMLANVVCARMEEVRAIVPSAPEGEPFMVLVETDVVPAEMRAVAMPPSRESVRSPDVPPNLDPLEYERQLRGRAHQLLLAQIRKTGALVRSLVVPDGAASRRLRQTRAAVAPEVTQRVETALAKDLMPADDDAMATASLLWSAGRVAGKNSYVKELARLARRTFIEQSIPGSAWAAAGCFFCGMGSVPEESRRFLNFFVEGADE